MIYVIKGVKILKVEEKTRVVRAWKVGDETKTETENLGWFVLLDGSYEFLYLGTEKPAMKPGQTVTLRLTVEGA